MHSFAQATTGGHASVPIAVLERPGSCITAQDFFALVSQRTALVRLARETEPATRFGVHVVAQARAAGELTISKAAGLESIRRIEGETCEEVAQALALVAALSVDPLAASGESSNVRALAPELASQPTPEPARAQRTSMVTLIEARVDVVAPARNTPSPNTSSANAPSANASTHQGVAIDGFARLGNADTAWLGLTGQYWLDLPVRVLGKAELRVFLGISRTLRTPWRVSTVEGAANLEFRQTSLELGACPWGIRWRRSARLHACAHASVGWLEVRQTSSSTGSESGSDDSGLWGGVGALSRSELHLYEGLGLGVVVGVLVPITRYRVSIDSLAGSPEQRLAAAALLGSVGVSWSHW